jgi:hypothetical protein
MHDGLGTASVVMYTAVPSMYVFCVLKIATGERSVIFLKHWPFVVVCSRTGNCVVTLRITGGLDFAHCPVF